MVTGWYGVGSALKAFLDVRKEQGLDLLQRMFRDARLFRIILDEVEKTLLAVDLDIARSYAELVGRRRGCAIRFSGASRASTG